MFIEVYTDGSATTADKSGGYGWVMLVDGQKYLEGSGHMDLASNNDAELEAAIQGLKIAYEYVSGAGIILQGGYKVVLVSDSEIILGWTSGKYRFKQENKMDKFKELQYYVKAVNVQTRWVEGHTGNEHNERCDRLANAARLGTDVDEIKTKKKKATPKENKVSVTYKVTVNRDLVDDFIADSIRHANEGKYEPGSNYWRMMLIDKFKELLDNSNYFTIEKE